MLEIILAILNYSSMFMYFPFFYRFLNPKVKFSTAFLSYFLIGVVGISIINTVIFSIQDTFLRMLIPEIILFVWTYFCFDDDVAHKMFACLCTILVTYAVEVSCMLAFYIIQGERLLEIFNHPKILLCFRTISILLDLGILEILIRFTRKHDIRNIPYFSIIIPIMIFIFLIGNCVQNLAIHVEIESMLNTVILTVLFSVPLLLWALKEIHNEFVKKNVQVLQKEVEQQYKILLEDYLNVTDTQLIQKYLRHDILNHLQVLKEITSDHQE